MTGADWVERVAVTLIMVPTGILILPIWAAINEPKLFLQSWDFFALFLGLPYAAALALWLWARMLRRTA